MKRLLLIAVLAVSLVLVGCTQIFGCAREITIRLPHNNNEVALCLTKSGGRFGDTTYYEGSLNGVKINYIHYSGTGTGASNTQNWLTYESDNLHYSYGENDISTYDVINNNNWSRIETKIYNCTLGNCGFEAKKIITRPNFPDLQSFLNGKRMSSNVTICSINGSFKEELVQLDGKITSMIRSGEGCPKQ